MCEPDYSLYVMVLKVDMGLGFHMPISEDPRCHRSGSAVRETVKEV